MASIWTKTVELATFPSLEGDTKTDVLIIGGGMAGVLCAHYLKLAGVDCLLVEENTVGSGVTCNTTAKITAQHGLIYDKLIGEFGLESGRMYLQANQKALEYYRTLCRDMNCDFQPRTNVVYTLDDRMIIERELEALQKIGFPARFVPELPLPFPIAGAVCFDDQAQFHPLQFLSAIAKNLPIFENTRVLEWMPGMAITQQGRIQAEKIIVATHFPFLNKHGSYFLKLYQHRSYVLALEKAPEVGAMCVDGAGNGLSFRSYEDRLLLGGGGHRTGKTGVGWALPETAARKYYPAAKVVARWATQDCMTLDGMPYIGQYSKGTPNLYVATGFQKWGMTTSMLAARLLTDLVQGRENPYEKLFSPYRSMLHKQLFLNGIESTRNLLRPTKPRCPHLGCALQWNAEERSWDCPCHGSRFTEDGKLLNNPATDDL
jgi:glycine/D-amino acid oxidase-like deaminating enzyme